MVVKIPAMVSCRITLGLQNLDAAIEARILNIGRGGMFVELKEKLPAKGGIISFKIHFDEGHIQVIAGDGIVRWTREEAAVDMKRGIGVGFMSLDDSTIARVMEYIEKSNPRAFIPKT